MTPCQESTEPTHEELRAALAVAVQDLEWLRERLGMPVTQIGLFSAERLNSGRGLGPVVRMTAGVLVLTREG